MARVKVLVFYPRYSEVYRELLEKQIPEADFLICRNREEVEEHASEVEIAFVPRNFPQDLFAKMTRLKWIQVMAAGVENYVQNAARFKEIPVCRIVGVFGKFMAEYVLGYILYLNQNIPRVLQAMSERKWDPFLPEFIHRKTVGIMGLGSIGGVIAQKAKGMEMRVVSWDMAKKTAPFVDRQYEAHEMKNFLQEADYVVLSLPATPETVNLVNHELLGAMKKTAHLINICRGALVDERALVDALKRKEIAGAVLDVVKEEPLPPASELWDCPNLIITPHICGPSLPEDMVECFKENFRRYLSKEPLLGCIDFEKGF
jgi:phosphoglycerate dehydrogenase-like enzyme